MILKGEITFLINRDNTSISIGCHESGMTIVELNLNPDQLSAILSRQGHVKCDVIFNDGNSNKFGKKMENKYFEFEISKEVRSRKETNELHQIALKEVEEGWIPDMYYGSQNSFFQKDGKDFARCTIRRWV